MRNFLATLFVSQGVPMLLAGDEMGRSQDGNNNAYCQDNEISWVNWDLEPWQRELLAFTRYLIRLYKRHPVLRRRAFFHGRPIRGYGSARPRLVPAGWRGDERAGLAETARRR